MCDASPRLLPTAGVSDQRLGAFIRHLLTAGVCNQRVGTSGRLLPTTGVSGRHVSASLGQPVDAYSGNFYETSNAHRIHIYHPKSMKLSGKVQLVQNLLLRDCDEIWTKIVRVMEVQTQITKCFAKRTIFVQIQPNSVRRWFFQPPTEARWFTFWDRRSAEAHIGRVCSRVFHNKVAFNVGIFG